MEVNEAQAIFDAARDQVPTIVVGKSIPITLTLTAL
ncbi:AAA family ATPase, partial [Lacticaseibacillus paracasei]